MAMIISARPTRLQLIYLRANVARLLPATENQAGFLPGFCNRVGKICCFASL
jgi:hypothetical protein